MIFERIDGDVTTNECKSFIDALHSLPPPPTNDIDNLMVDERDGATIHGMQTFYAFTHDRRDLDMMVVWSDAFLHARNDPTNGRIIWTGKRDLCWPNKATNDEAHSLYSGTENGDVIEHIVNTAKLILENPSIWPEQAPTDTYGFGKSYLDRAKTYVNECQKSAETTIIPWFVRKTKDGYRLYNPDSPAYYKYCESSGPVPWNQQQFITGGLLRLAQCHRLLNDGNTNISYYEKITADAADWFFATAVPVSAHNRVCYDWAYVPTMNPAVEPESTVESDYDMFIFRAFQANLGPTRLQMQRLVNTARFVMYCSTNHFAGHVNGTSDRRGNRDGDRDFLDFQWIEMSVLDHEFYQMVASTALTNHEYYDKLGLEAAVLSAKHYWATYSPMPEPQEVLDPAKLPPPVKKISPIIALVLRHTPNSLASASRTPAATMLLLFIVSGVGLIFAGRSNSDAVSRDRRLVKIIWLVNSVSIALGTIAAFRLSAYKVSWPGTVEALAFALFGLGLALQWYGSIRSVKANAAGGADKRAIDSGPYRFIRHSGLAGNLLAIVGLSLCYENWATLLIMCVPACAVTLWRIRAVPPPHKVEVSPKNSLIRKS